MKGGRRSRGAWWGADGAGGGMLPGGLAVATGISSNLGKIGGACEIHNCLSIFNLTDARSVVLALADADPLGVNTVLHLRGSH